MNSIALSPGRTRAEGTRRSSSRGACSSSAGLTSSASGVQSAGCWRWRCEVRLGADAPVGGLPSEREREISPLFWIGTIAKELSNPFGDGGELVVAKRPDQDATGMMTVSFGPLAQQWGEVP
jgi:hypothetical protein